MQSERGQCGCSTAPRTKGGNCSIRPRERNGMPVHVTGGPPRGDGATGTRDGADGAARVAGLRESCRLGTSGKPWSTHFSLPSRAVPGAGAIAQRPPCLIGACCSRGPKYSYSTPRTDSAHKSASAQARSGAPSARRSRSEVELVDGGIDAEPLQEAVRQRERGGGDRSFDASLGEPGVLAEQGFPASPSDQRLGLSPRTEGRPG